LSRYYHHLHDKWLNGEVDTVARMIDVCCVRIGYNYRMEGS